MRKGIGRDHVPSVAAASLLLSLGEEEKEKREIAVETETGMKREGRRGPAEERRGRKRNMGERDG